MLVLLLTASATAGKADGWDSYGLFLPELKEHVSPATGERREWKILSVAPAGTRRYLLLLESSRMRLSSWSNEKALVEERQKNLFLGKEHLTKRQSQVFLAVFNHQGKLVSQSAAQEEGQGQVGIFPNSWSVPLVMEQATTCQYAFLDAVGANLYCYDLQLSFQRKLALPVHEVGQPALLMEGDTYWLVVFGRKLSQPLRLEDLKNFGLVRPEVPESLGCFWRVGEKDARPLPFSVEELHQRLAKLARDHQGNRVTVQKASLSLIPIETLNPGETLDVLVEAVAAPVYESYVKFEGVRLFFQARLAPTGLTVGKQLPFWVVQETREAPELDEKRGVLKLPAFAKNNKLRAFKLRGNNLGIYLECAYKTPRPDGSFDPRLWDLGKYFATFSGSALAHVYELDAEVLGEARRTLSTQELSVSPVTLEAMVAPNRFAFGAICKKKQMGEVSRQPCFVFAEVGD
ncbi:MAG: hypothetical protein ACK42L_00030 [Thermoanaerobaculum sp.]